MVQEYETIFRSQKKRILIVVFCQGKIFKRFKDSGRFVKMTKEIRVSQSTVYLKLNLLKVWGISEAKETNIVFK